MVTEGNRAEARRNGSRTHWTTGDGEVMSPAAPIGFWPAEVTEEDEEETAVEAVAYTTSEDTGVPARYMDAGVVGREGGVEGSSRSALGEGEGEGDATEALLPWIWEEGRGGVTARKWEWKTEGEGG